MSQIIDVSGLPESVINEIELHVAQIRERLLQPRPSHPDKLSTEEWVRRFITWTQSQRSTNPHFDDSRESIYEGRGE